MTESQTTRYRDQINTNLPSQFHCSVRTHPVPGVVATTNVLSSFERHVPQYNGEDETVGPEMHESDSSDRRWWTTESTNV